MPELDQKILALADAIRQNPETDPEGIREFQALVMAVAIEFKRYQLESRSNVGQVAFGTLSLSQCRQHLSAFLHHVGFFSRLPSSLPEAHDIADELKVEFGRTHCSLTNLIILDGLDIPGDEICFDGGRLIRLDSKVLTAWFGGAKPPGPVSAERLDDIVALETVTSGHNPPFGPMHISWEAPYRTVLRTVHPWLTLLNLYGDGKCSAIGLYQRSDSRLHRDQFDAIGVREPNWEDKSFYDDEAQEWVEYDQPYRTLEVDDAERFGSFLNRVELGRLGAESRGHRAAAALRYFDRVSAGHLRHILSRGMDDHPDDLEDLIVDAVVGLEVIFVQNKKIKSKGDVIARRVAAMTQRDTAEARQLRKLAKKLYECRNSILHGDEQLPIADLLLNAVGAEELLRRSLSAFCLIGGDHQRVISMDADLSAAAIIRAETQF